MLRPSHRTRAFLLLGLLLALTVLIAGCDDDAENSDLENENQADNPETVDLGSIDSIEELVNVMSMVAGEDLQGHTFEIDAWISPPPTTSGIPSTPAEGCPVVPEKQDWLSDEAIETQFEVAGATIPNERLSEDIPVMRLVVPYTLGFVEIPERAILRGRVLDDEFMGCSAVESLFILDEIVEELPAERADPEQEVVSEWD
jgi:hypothetical protein